MVDRDGRAGTGGTEDNVLHDLDEAARGRERRDATTGTVEGEERTGGPGGVKSNVEDDHAKTRKTFVDPNSGKTGPGSKSL